MNSEQADILDLLSGHTDDTTIERLAFECLLTNMTDDRVVSLMNILGWQGDFNCFAIGGGPLYLSPVRSGVAGASHALRETMFSLQAAPALSTPSRPLRADELLPERALLGDDYAREELYRNVYQVLRGENPDDPTYLTVSTFLKYGSSLENTAKELNVHPNTVRYRLKRAAETTGWDATDPRDAYVLTTALAIGRMRDR